MRLLTKICWGLFVAAVVCNRAEATALFVDVGVAFGTGTCGSGCFNIVKIHTAPWGGGEDSAGGGQSGGTWNIYLGQHDNLAYGSIRVDFYANGSCSGTPVHSYGQNMNTNDASQAFSLVVDCGGAEPPLPTNCIVRMDVRNNGILQQKYTAFHHGLAFDTGGGGLLQMTVNSGATGTMSITVPNCDTTEWELRYSEVFGQPSPVQPNPPLTNYTAGASGGGSPGVPTPNVTGGQPPPIYNGPGSGTNINWNGGGGTNVSLDGSVQRGFDALYDVEAKGLAGLDADLKLIDGHVVGGFGATTGLLNQANGTLTGMSNGIRAFHIDNTNLLTAAKNLLGVLTNQLGTLTGYRTNGIDPLGLLGGASTNATGATTAANDLVAGITGAAETARGAFGTPDTYDALGSPAGMSIAFGGTTLNLDPESIAPGAMGWIKGLVTCIATIGFGLSMGALFVKLTHIYASAETGGVPNMDLKLAGFGGNVAGVAISVIVAIAMVALWVAVFTAFFAFALPIVIEVCVDDHSSTYSITNYLMNSVFPVNLLFALAFSRVAGQFLMGKVVLVAASASRFLLGK